MLTLRPSAANQQKHLKQRLNDGWVKPSTPIALSEHDVRRAFKYVNTMKAAGPGGISGRVLKQYADQLAPIFTVIFSLSLAQSLMLQEVHHHSCTQENKTSLPE